MTKHLLIVGHRNDISSDPDDAMEPYTPRGAGERLYKMVALGRPRITKELYLDMIAFANAEPAPASTSSLIYTYQSTVVLGRAAWVLLRLPSHPVYWKEMLPGVWLVPHPSGKNQVYNHMSAIVKTGDLIARLSGLEEFK